MMNFPDDYTLLHIFLLVPESIHEIAKASDHFCKVINGSCLGKFLLDNSWETICQSAIKYKRVDYLKFLLTHGCVIDDELMIYASKGKDIECLRYICENVKEIEPDIAFRMIHDAACSGDPDCFEYIYTKFKTKPTHPVSCRPVIESGSLDCVKIAIKLHMPQFMTPYACECAAEYGHLHILKYLHRNRCGWNANTSRAAFKNMHWSCLRYANQNGCPILDQDNKVLIMMMLGITVVNGVALYYVGPIMINTVNSCIGYDLFPLVRLNHYF